MKQDFIDWLDVNGIDVTYQVGGSTSRAIKADFERTQAEEIDDGTGRQYIERAILRVADNATYGVLKSEIDRRDRVMIGSDTWSVSDEGISDGFGMNSLNIVLVKSKRRQREGIEGQL